VGFRDFLPFGQNDIFYDGEGKLVANNLDLASSLHDEIVDFCKETGGFPYGVESIGRLNCLFRTVMLVLAPVDFLHVLVPLEYGIVSSH